METLLYQIWHAFFLLIVIMGPFTGLPIFLKITDGFKEQRRHRSALRAIRFSAGMFLFFALFGSGILWLFGISFEGFKVAGGIVLLLMGIAYLFDIEYQKAERYTAGLLVPFATPLIIGPGAIMTTILLVSLYGHVITIIGGGLALLVYWTFLRFSTSIVARIGHQGIEVVARIMGLLLMAIAIDMMRSGVVGFIQIGIGG